MRLLFDAGARRRAPNGSSTTSGTVTRRPSAAKTLQKYVSELRKLLPDLSVADDAAGGYVLDVDRDAVDAHRFERLVADGDVRRRAGARGGATC